MLSKYDILWYFILLIVLNKVLKKSHVWGKSQPEQGEGDSEGPANQISYGSVTTKSFNLVTQNPIKKEYQWSHFYLKNLVDFKKLVASLMIHAKAYAKLT